MQNSNLKRADEIHIGEKVSLATALEVVGVGNFGGNKVLTLAINPERQVSMYLHPDSFLAVHDEPEEMPDNGEIMDRLLAVIVQYTPITKSIMDAVEALVVNNLLDIPSVIELTNDLGPFDLGPVRSCRVCGCTDDDCSQCIQATGEACHWVGEDLCSRCAQSEIVNPKSEIG